MTAYLQAATTLIPEFLAELQAWVDIDSGTDDKAGVDRVGVLVRERLERAGFAVTVQPQSVYGDHLVARRAGQGQLRLLLIGHMDTVYPKGDVALRPFTIRDGRAYGPGIFDMKSGILAGITALELVGPATLDAFASVTFICNSDEEVGSPSSTPLVRAEAAQADAVLVLEPTRDPATVTVARKGIATYTLDVAGVSAHAGVTPESGRNAILELAHLIVALQGLNGTIPTLSVNIGAVTGGGRRNVVPAQAQAIFEMRAANQAHFDEGRAAIAAIIAAPRTVPDTSVTLTAGPTHLPLTLTEGARRMVALAQIAANELGLTLRPLSIGGASDGNTTGGMGIPTLDGLGLIGQSSHHPEEHILIAAIPTRLALLAGLIAQLATHQTL
jgi:glutamate carboxypeptidase